MPRFAANLSFLFTELPFLDRFEAAAKAGFKGVEFMFPYAFAADDIRARLDAHGLEMVLFNLPPGHWDKGERGYTALPGRDDDFASAVDLALALCRDAELSQAARAGGSHGSWCAPRHLHRQSQAGGAVGGAFRRLDPDRAHQHARHAGLFPDAARPTPAPSSRRPASPTSACSSTSTIAPCMEGGRRRRPSTSSAPWCAIISVRTLPTAASPI